MNFAQMITAANLAAIAWVPVCMMLDWHPPFWEFCTVGGAIWAVTLSGLLLLKIYEPEKTSAKP